MEGWPTQVVSPAPLASAAAWQLTVLLPTYNEELAIEFVLDEIVDALRGLRLRYEILIVDDASTDRTASLVRRYAAGCEQCEVRIVSCPERRGAEPCAEGGHPAGPGRGNRHARCRRHLPGPAIPQLLRHFPQYDQVNGARTSEQGTLPWLRRPAKWLIRKLACSPVGQGDPGSQHGAEGFQAGGDAPLAVGRARVCSAP